MEKFLKILTAVTATLVTAAEFLKQTNNLICSVKKFEKEQYEAPTVKIND